MVSYQIFDFDKSNISVSSKGIIMLKKSLLTHTFWCDWSLFSVAKEWKQFRQQKSPQCLEVILLNNANSFWLQDNAIFFSLHSKSWKE